MKTYDKYTNDLIIRLVERFNVYVSYVGNESPLVDETARVMCGNAITGMWAITQG